MTWLKGLLIALGLVVVLAIAILAALGLLSSDKGREVRHISVGQRTITVSHFKNFTQQSIADGVKIIVDDHVITATPDAIAIDGTEQSIDPSQDVEITVDEAGTVAVKAISPETPSPEKMSPGEGAPAEAPAQ